MKSSHFLMALACTLAASLALALEIKPYSAEALSAAQKAGKPVALHFRADWCPVCRAQDKVLDGFKADKALDVTVLTVDYDAEKALEKKLKVSTQSTLIVYKGASEKARLAGDTEPEKLRAALATAK